MLKLAKILVVTNAVELPPDMSAAATQAPRLHSLPYLGLALLSAVPITLLNLSVPVVHGQKAQPVLRHPLLIHPSTSPSVFMIRLSSEP